jgi:hypothetical protein
MAEDRKSGAVVPPEDGVKEGWWGSSPVHKDRVEFTVEKAGPRAVEANSGGARAEGVGEVDKDAPKRQEIPANPAANTSPKNSKENVK